MISCYSLQNNSCYKSNTKSKIWAKSTAVYNYIPRQPTEIEPNSILTVYKDIPQSINPLTSGQNSTPDWT